jgi:hypothetical protein
MAGASGTSAAQSGIRQMQIGDGFAQRCFVVIGACYGEIQGEGSFVVYQTDKESSDRGWKFTTMVLSETV